MTSEIIWTGTPEDQTARSGEYTLRIWSYGHYFDFWMYMVFYNGFEVARGNRRLGVNKAKAAAIAAMKEHLKTNL